jgi:aromatic ring-cleaving dioxygenase
VQTLDPSTIDSWHAHVYFDASTRDAAWVLRGVIEAQLAGRIEMGRFHEKLVGPHPLWSYQLAFAAAEFSHPNTGDALRDHRDSALWLGRSHTLNLAALIS